MSGEAFVILTVGKWLAAENDVDKKAFQKKTVTEKYHKSAKKHDITVKLSTFLIKQEHTRFYPQL